MTDIFLRSYAKDLPWVPFALRSIQKFVTGIEDVLVCVPEEDVQGFNDLHMVLETLVQSKVPTRNGYMDQMVDKLMADLYTEAEYILYWDSDCIATRKFSPEDLMIMGKPRCLMTPYSKLVGPDGKPDTPWQAVTEKAIGQAVEFEFMRCHPFLVHRKALAGFRKFMQLRHGCSISEYIERQPNRSFSEFNALHAWAYYHQTDLFSFWHTDVSVPEPFVKQHWSWGGVTPEIRAEMERILA